MSQYTVLNIIEFGAKLICSYKWGTIYTSPTEAPILGKTISPPYKLEFLKKSYESLDIYTLPEDLALPDKSAVLTNIA